MCIRKRTLRLSSSVTVLWVDIWECMHCSPLRSINLVRLWPNVAQTTSLNFKNSVSLC